MPDVVADYVDAIESLFVGFTQGNRSILRQKNLTAVQFLVIQWAFTEGPANMTALATFLGVRPQSVTPIIDSLVRRGWIRREHDLKDRRQTLLRISPEALRLMTEFRRIHIRRLKNALRKVPCTSLGHATAVLRVTQHALSDSLNRIPSDRPLTVR